MIALSGQYTPSKGKIIDTARHSPEVIANAIRIPPEGLKLIVDGHTIHVDAERAKRTILAVIAEKNPGKVFGEKDWLKQGYDMIMQYVGHCLTFGDDMTEHILNVENILKHRESSKAHGFPYSTEHILPAHETHAPPRKPGKMEYRYE